MLIRTLFTFAAVTSTTACLLVIITACFAFSSRTWSSSFTIATIIIFSTFHWTTNFFFLTIRCRCNCVDHRESDVNRRCWYFCSNRCWSRCSRRGFFNHRSSNRLGRFRLWLLSFLLSLQLGKIFLLFSLNLFRAALYESFLFTYFNTDSFATRSAQSCCRFALQSNFLRAIGFTAGAFF